MFQLSCIDCGEMFGQESVQSHTQCITEAVSLFIVFISNNLIELASLGDFYELGYALTV